MQSIIKFGASVFVAVAVALCGSSSHATLSKVTQASSDGFNGSIAGIVEPPGTTGTIDVDYYNYQGSNWAYKRDFCGGAASTYASAADGRFPNSVGQTTSFGGLSVTLAYATSSMRTYRFAGLTSGVASNMCFVSGDGYYSGTITVTTAVTPQPSISNIRVLNDANSVGGKSICVDYTPTNPVITSFDWIENGVATNGNSSALWQSYICLIRTSTLVEGSTYSVQLRYNGPSGSKSSNTLSITIPYTTPLPGAIATVTASNNDTSIPGKIRLNWTASSNATSYNVWRTTTGSYVAVVGSLSVTDSPPQTGTSYGYIVQGVNATGVGPWSTQASGVAAPVPPPTCTTPLTASAALVSSSTASVRLSVQGVTNATGVLLTTWPWVNGAWGGGSLWTATNGGNGYWYADVPLTAGSYASSYGQFLSAGTLLYSAGSAPCGDPAVRFTRREPQAASFNSPVIAGVTGGSSVTLIAGRSYPFSYVVTNTGQSTWVPATSSAANTGHKLSTTNPNDNSNFGFQRFVMPPTSVAPGASTTVNGTLTGSQGTYNLQLQVIEENLERFGASANVAITFSAAPTAATTVAATDGDFGDRVRITWVPGANIAAQNVMRAAAGAAWPTGTLTGQPAGWTVVCQSLASTTGVCDDTTGVPGTTYSYRVFGWSNAVGSAAGGWDQGAVSIADTGFSAAPLTIAPSLTSVTTTLTTAINATWAPYTGASSFEVQRRTNVPGSTADATIAVPGGSVTSYADTSVLRGEARCYKVRAINVAGPSPWSNELCGLRAGYVAPALTASWGTVTGATRLTWGAATGYAPVSTQIYRLVSSSDFTAWELLASLSGAAGTYDDASARGADVLPDAYRIHQVDSAGNATAWFMNSTSSYSTNVAYGYANIAPTAITIPAISAVSNASTTPVLLAVTDLNAASGYAESIAWVASNPTTGSTAGTCSIVSGNQLQWTPPPDLSFAGPRVCVVTVTDKGGATLSAQASFVVQAYLPGAPVGVVATDGTVTDAVNVTWTAVPTSTYKIYRDGTQIGVANTNAYSDTSAVGVTPYAYSVRAVATAGGESPMSGTDSGYANRAPTSSSATLTVAAVTPGAVTSVVPGVVDPNAAAGQGESYTFAITTQLPSGTGVVSVVGGTLRYTAPALIDFAGSQSFVYTVTDKGGAAISATGVVVMPALDKVTVVSTITPTSIAVGVGSTFSLGGTYKNDGNTTWESTNYQFATIAPQGSGFTITGPATMKLAGPGQTVVLKSILSAPLTTGSYDIVVGVSKPAESATPIASSTTIRVNVVAPVDCGIATVYTESSVVTSITGGLSVTGSNIAGAESVRFRVYGVAGGDADAKTYAGSLVGGVWTGLIDLAQHSAAAPEFGDFVVEAWVTKAPFADKVCATGAFRRDFPSPPNVNATQGTQTGTVGVTWDAIPAVGGVSPSGYIVLRCSAATTAPSFGAGRAVPTGCVAAGAVGGSATSFTDTLADTSEVRYRYAVAALEGPLSAGVLGWPNLPPVGATLAATVGSRGNPVVLPAPVGGDPNPDDVLTFALGVPAVSRTRSALGAMITINAAGLFVYTPNPNTPMPTGLGVDSFPFVVVDKAGAFTPAVASLSVCPPASVFSVNAQANPLITANGLVSRLTCNGAVSLGWTALRVGESATAGASASTPSTGTNVADPTRVAVSGSSFYSVVALTPGLATTSGLYELRANVVDIFGARTESEPITVDVPCAAPLLSFGAGQANHKTSVVSVTGTVRETDLCQRGATYRVVARTPLPDGTVRSADAVVAGSAPARTTTSYGLGDINVANNTTWVTDIVRAGGQRTADLIGFNATRETSRLTAPLNFTCPGVQILGGNLWAQSNQTMYTLNMSMPVCAPDETISLIVDGVEYLGQPGDAAAFSQTRTTTFAFTVPMPPEDGPRSLQIKRTPTAGAPVFQSMTVVYDSRTVTPLYNIVGSGSGTTTINSLGRLILVPRTQ